MGQDASEIRQNIEVTRQRMGETVEALSYKTDVRARVGDAVAGKRDAIVGKKDDLVNRIAGAAPDPNAIKDNAQQAISVQPRGIRWAWRSAHWRSASWRAWWCRQRAWRMSNSARLRIR